MEGIDAVRCYTLAPPWTWTLTDDSRRCVIWVNSIANRIYHLNLHRIVGEAPCSIPTRLSSLNAQKNYTLKRTKIPIHFLKIYVGSRKFHGPVHRVPRVRTVYIICIHFILGEMRRVQHIPDPQRVEGSRMCTRKWSKSRIYIFKIYVGRRI
ncbi:hypothetical protein CPB83DRAFT_851907 [Crepidotus variabilis]|uniref:Uncharacterized protein n=1 Tax=Crepidotus variabilis TaxID=179855 RepID=A0A9P6JR66_9AGAR|nr:hypothetical protein CPB83DRAFT_851907 [Crepidotus variabilis]